MLLGEVQIIIVTQNITKIWCFEFHDYKDIVNGLIGLQVDIRNNKIKDTSCENIWLSLR